MMGSLANKRGAVDKNIRTNNNLLIGSPPVIKTYMVQKKIKNNSKRLIRSMTGDAQKFTG